MRLVTFRDPDGTERVGELAGERVLELRAPTMLDWLAGAGRDPADREHALADVALLAPVPTPPSVRDFFTYEGHVAAGWRRRGSEIPPAWFDAPVFYFSNPASIRGPGEAVARPAATKMLDFELEIAAVVDGGGEIAGFTLMNDWSARDVQREEMTVGLGPAKGKDFATSLGPWLVTLDELPYDDGRLQVSATVSVNGAQVGGGDAALAHYSWPQILTHAARDTRLRAGDVLGSGTITGGCLMELGPLDGERWIEPGDIVTLEADGLGTLETPVV